MRRESLVPITPGAVSAKLLRLDAPISFWGGVDWATGRIIDRSHPQNATPATDVSAPAYSWSTDLVNFSADGAKISAPTLNWKRAHRNRRSCRTQAYRE